jgi:ABC-type glycerol-3-phosphate transport system permease component
VFLLSRTTRRSRRPWHHGGCLDELLAVAGINLMAIPVVLVCAVFARGYVRGLTAAMLEGS